MIDDLRALLPAYLGRQRWFAGAPPERVDIVAHEQVVDRLEWVLLEAGGPRYQLFVARAGDEMPEFLHGQEPAVIGHAEAGLYYDGLVDGELAKALLARLAPGEEVTWVRPMGAEQSNTSLVFDDRLVLKVFRRIHEGPNPDVEVSGALAAAGFPHVAAPLATWEREGVHLVVVQPFLGGGTDGWALALTSLRDYYGSPCADPAECGGDFAAEAGRLGEVTARMHLALGDAFGRAAGDARAWVAAMERQLERVGAGRPWEHDARKVLQRLAEMDTPGTAIRVHGDYHLAQALRTDTGWFVLDFEGEPSRPLEERRQPSSPLKDVAGMLRSFDYATAVALREQPEDARETHESEGEEWARRNRHAFLEGYLTTEGVAGLLPTDMHDVLVALAAWELDKAVYELAYELDHRPDWAPIPEAAISRLVHG